MGVKILKTHLSAFLAVFLAVQSIHAAAPFGSEDFEERRIHKAQHIVAVYGDPVDYDPPIDQGDFLTEVQRHVPQPCQILIFSTLASFCTLGMMDIAMVFVRLCQFYFSEAEDARFPR